MKAHLPEGTLVAITGGKDIADPAAVIARLDKARAKYNDLILVHGGGPGVERTAARWAAPFRRNDDLLNLLPKGVIAFPGSGITDNLVGKAKVLGIPVLQSGIDRIAGRVVIPAARSVFSNPIIGVAATPNLARASRRARPCRPRRHRASPRRIVLAPRVLPPPRRPACSARPPAAASSTPT